MNAGAITPASSSRVMDDEPHYTTCLKEAAPEMLALLLRISESTPHLPALYESADAASAFIDRLISGEKINTHETN